MIILLVTAILLIFCPTIVLVMVGSADTRVSVMTSSQILTFLLLMVLPAIGGMVFGALVAGRLTEFSQRGGSDLQ